MKTPFNDYEAYNDLGNEISDKVDDFMKIIIATYPEVSTRDLESIIISGVTIDLAETRLCRAMAKRKKERH